MRVSVHPPTACIMYVAVSEDSRAQKDLKEQCKGNKADPSHCTARVKLLGAAFPGICCSVTVQSPSSVNSNLR